MRRRKGVKALPLFKVLLSVAEEDAVGSLQALRRRIRTGVRGFAEVSCRQVPTIGEGRRSLQSLTPIVALLNGSRPSAVLRRVIATRIRRAVKRSTFWSCSHIDEEVLELQPPLTNLDPVPAVASEVPMFRIKTPLLHRLPRTIFRCGPLSAIVPMLYEVIGGTAARLICEASATLYRTAVQRETLSRDSLSAITSASPKKVTMLSSTCATQYDEPAKSLTC